ncbi:reverse transcriptase domain-containing protein [Tanacetum coccineum]
MNKCPHHGFSPLHQIDTFYNGLNQSDQDSLNSAAGGNLLTRNTQEALTIIENKSKVRTSRNKPQVSSASGSSSQNDVITALIKQVEALISSMTKPIHSIQEGCETCGGQHSYYECQATGGYNQDVYATTGNYNAGGQLTKALQDRPRGVLLSNTVPSPREDTKVFTARSGNTLAGPSVPPLFLFLSSKEWMRCPETITDQRNPHQPPIPYPSRLNKEKLQDKSDIQIHRFLQMFKKLHFNISFPEALAYMPKYAKMLKYVLTNKEKLLELANTPLNENCLAVLLKKLPEKLGDPGKFLIPCDFDELEECMALADLGASINLMPLFVWKKLMLPELVPTRMTLELANRSVAYPAGRPFLRTARALVDVYGEELTLRVGDEKLVFNVESTSKYPRKHGDESIHMIDILDTTCEDYFHEVLNVQKLIHPLSGNPTPSSDPVVESLSPSLTSFEDSDFLLEETDEKCHFMVKKGIVLGHKIFKSGIEVDRAKVDVIAKLPPSTMCQSSFEILKKQLTEAPILVSPDWDLPFEIICDASAFDVGFVLGQRKEKHFQPIYYASKTLSDAQTHYTTTEKELLAVVYAFEKLWSYLVFSKTIVYTDHSTLKYLFAKQDAKPRLENPHQGDLVGMEINDNFPHESLNMISRNPDNGPPWFADIANYLVGFVPIKLSSDVWTGRKLWIFLKLATMVSPGDIMARTTLPRKFSSLVSFVLPYIAMPMTWSHIVTHVNVKEKSHKGMKYPIILSKMLRSLTYGASTLWARSRLHEGTDIYSWMLTMCLNGLKRRRSPQMTPK